MDSRELVVGAERYKRHLDRRYGCRVWTEPLTQHGQVRQPARIQVRIDQPCQLSLAATIVGERTWGKGSVQNIMEFKPTGGQIVFEGAPADLVAARPTLTGEHLATYVGT